MPWSSPSLKELIAQAKANIEIATDGAASIYTRFEAAVSRALAAMAWGLHRHIAYVQREFMLKGASTGEGVEFWAGLLGIETKAATKATGTLSVTSTAPANVVIGDTWTRADGAIYESTENVAFTDAGGETLPVAVEALVAGADGELDAGAVVELVSPILNIESEGTVLADIDGGEDEETPDEKRARVRRRTATAPLGGGPGDWEGWCLEIAGITRAWEIPNGDGPGTVIVLVVSDGNDPITPDAGVVVEAQAYVDSEAPIVIQGRVAAPTLIDLDITVELSPDTPAIRAAVEIEVADMLARVAEPGVTVFPSQISEAISIATDEESHDMTVPAASITYGAQEIPVLGTITYV